MEKIIIEVTGDPKTLKPTLDALTQLGVVDDKNAAKFKKNNEAAQKSLKDTGVAAKGLETDFQRLGDRITAAFSVAAIIAFAKQAGSAIINTRAEFQKFEAQLTTALGSSSAAQAALTRIQQFAKETPFGVSEITQAFVKLANRGITPTNDQLRKMGDLSAALSKPIEELNEAILDISNDKRWTELGIAVSKSGNKIIGTFRGQRVEAEATTAGALKMVETFGEMKGVAGGMERQMKTLGGAMSNFSDTTEKLANNLGKSGEGGLYSIIVGLTEVIDKYASALGNANTTSERLFSGNSFKDWLGKAANQALALTQGIDFFGTAIGNTDEVVEKAINTYNNYTSALDKNDKELSKSKAREAYSILLKRIAQEEANLVKITDDYTRSLKQQYITSGRIALQQSYVDTVASIENGTKVTIDNTAAKKKAADQLKKELDLLDALRKKLRELQSEYKEISANDEEGEKKAAHIFEIKRERIEADISDQQKKAKEEIKNSSRLAEALVLIEQIKNQTLKNLELNYAQEIDHIREKLMSEAVERAHKIAEMQIEVMKLNHDDEADIYQARLAETEKYFDDKIALEESALKREELIKQKEFELFKLEISEEQRLKKLSHDLESEAERHALEMARIQGKKAEELLAMELDYAQKARMQADIEFGDESLEYKKALDKELELQAQYNELKKTLHKENFKNAMDGVNEIVQATLKAYETMVEGEISANQTKIQNQNSILDQQKVLAQKGLDNNLAFEQKKQDELFKQQLQAKKKLQKVKELEVFLNALANFAEDNPKTALAKSLGLLAATKVAEAIFAEEGAIVGVDEKKFTGQSHRSGNNKIAIVEDGEVILPKHKAAELGLNSRAAFKEYLKKPLQEIPMPVPVSAKQSYSAIESKLDNIEKAIINRPENNYDFVGMNARLTEIKYALKKVTEIKQRRL